MILVLIISIPLVAGLMAWAAEKYGDTWPRWIALAALILDLVLTVYLPAAGSAGGRWYADVNAPWLPSVGIGFHLAADGLSLVMILLTVILGVIGIASAWTEIRERVGFFHFHLLWCIAGILAVFTAIDLFLFYFFWELMLVPMYFLIALWGHENRKPAAIKFFIFTQLSGLLMLAAILGLYFVHARQTGVYTFDYLQLIGTAMGSRTARFLMLGFLAAFLVKLPAIPFHTWLPDAHTEAPTAGSVLLAGLLLKTGAYGILRIAVPLFPGASAGIAGVMMILAVAGILYGAVMAFAQTDLKRLVAYTSVSHMGFVLLGIYAWNEWALQGAVIQMVCHGISTGALFMIVGLLQERIGTRDMTRMGGLWAAVPKIGGATILFALASIGLPGLGNFVGEFLVLLGTYRISPALAGAAAAGLVLSTVYAVWMVQKTLFGEMTLTRSIPDFNPRETAAVAVLAFLILLIGLYPQPVIDFSRHGLENLKAARPFAAQPFSAQASRSGGGTEVDR